MFEAIPVVKLRGDLKPGTVFRYQNTYRADYADRTYAADNWNLPGAPEPTHEEEWPSMDSAVVVLWDPDYDDLLDEFDAPEFTPPVTPSAPSPTPAIVEALALKDKKLPLWAVPPALIIGAAKAFAEGLVKYGPFSWRKPEVKIEATAYIGAIQRHLAAYADGEDVDPESPSGKLHIEGIAASLGILLDATYGGYLIDNRPLSGPAPAMLRAPKDKK